MIHYTDSLEGVSAETLVGFFVGWPAPPSSETHLELLQKSDAVELAIDTDAGAVVGFATALTDHVLTLYLSYLEVLPVYQHRGIGTELTRRLLSRFEHLYGVNLNCDPDLQPFYERLGMQRGSGMMIRR